MNRKYLVIVLAFFTFQAVSQKAEDSFQTGMTFQNEKNYTSAIENYTKALQVDSRFYDAIYQRAYCNNRLKNYNQAKSDLLFLADKKAWKSKELVFFELGYCYDNIKQTDSANYYYQQSAMANPSYAPPFKVIGKKLFYSKKYELAWQYLAKYNGLSEGKDEDYQFWFMYGFCEKELEYSKATDYLTQSKSLFLKENSDSYDNLTQNKRLFLAKVCYNLYECTLLKDNIESAISNYEEAISLDTTYDNNLIYWKSLGDSYYRTGDFSNALKYYKKLLELNSNDADLLSVMARIYREELKEYSNAISCYNKLYLLNANDLTYLGSIAEVYMNDLKDYSSAEKYYKQILEKSPDDQNWVNLGALYVVQKKYDSAIEIFLKIKPKFLEWGSSTTTYSNREHSVANYYLSSIYVEKGDKQKALNYYSLGINLFGLGMDNLVHSFENLKIRIDKMP